MTGQDVETNETTQPLRKLETEYPGNPAARQLISATANLAEELLPNELLPDLKVPAERLPSPFTNGMEEMPIGEITNLI